MASLPSYIYIYIKGIKLSKFNWSLSQRPRGIRCIRCWITRTQGSLVRIPFITWMSAFNCVVLFCICRHLAKGRSFVQGEGRVVPVLFLTGHHAMRAYWGVELWLHSFFDFGTRWRWVVSFTARPLYLQGKSPCYPLDRRLGEPQSRSEHGGEEKISSPCQNSNPRSSSP
jgi:hypothetical protein